MFLHFISPQRTRRRRPLGGRACAKALLLAAVAFCSPVALAEETQGSLKGRVLTLSGKPAGDARVVLVELARGVFAGGDGEYRFEDLPPGRYHVQAISERSGSGVIEVVIGDGPVEADIELAIEPHQETIVVTTTTRGRGSAEAYRPVTALDRAELSEKMQTTIGDTLSGEPGVHSSSFGPGAGRPVIRGQTAGRVRVLEGGLDSGDASVTSPDHAVSTDPLVADRIEIVRGPATLRYGSAAMGGVVNVLDERVPSYAPQAHFGGTFSVRGGSAADEKTSAAVLGGGAGAFAWHADFLDRSTGDVQIPGPAVEGDPGSPSSVLPNSALRSQGITLGGAWVTDKGFLGAAVRRLDTLYGIPAELELSDPNMPSGMGSVKIDLDQKRLDVRGGIDRPFGIFDGIRFSAGATDYEHRELEGADVGTIFRNELVETRVELTHREGQRSSGVIGVQASARDFEAVGEEAFLPPTETDLLAIFALQEFEPVEPFRIEVGARLETQEVDATGAAPASRSFDGVSASAGLLWQPNETYSLGGSVSRSARLPAAEELYSSGPHLATLSFEIGNPALRQETALGVDVIFRKLSGRFTGSLNLFLIDTADYIFEAPDGTTLDGLPVFRFGQADAGFHGFEAVGIVELVHSEEHDFDLSVTIDRVKAEFSAGGARLPFIPPMRVGARLHYRGPRWHASLEATRHEKQDRIASFETPTDGYTLLSASVGVRLVSTGAIHEILLRGRNLTDRLARNHVSRLKSLVPLPGTDLSAVYRVIF